MSVTALAVGSAAWAGCAAEPRRAVAPARGATQPAVELVSGSELLPDVSDPDEVVGGLMASQMALVSGMRMLIGDDATLRRAAERFTTRDTVVTQLPERLGGGFLFVARSSGGADLWRSESWLGELRPLARISQRVDAVIPGFDRVYLSMERTNSLIGMDPNTGALVGRGTLPPAGLYGPLAFVDGWQAVVVADIRGPLATFDAGATWHPLGLEEPVTYVSAADAAEAPGAHIKVSGGTYTLAQDGGLRFRRDERSQPSDAILAVSPPKTSLWGSRPLRAAIEGGWPDSDHTAIVAGNGELARVSLRDGALLARLPSAFPDKQASCHGALVRSGFGFICGEVEGATSVYGFEPATAAHPMRLVPVWRSARPRFISPSGNGALVVRGTCADDAAPRAGLESYCVLHPSGAETNVDVKGGLGAERVVGLRDGGVAVLIPPRAGASPALTIVRGARSTRVKLDFSTVSEEDRATLDAGMWLPGFEERTPGRLSGWVERGGPLLGVSVGTDGKIEVGERRDEQRSIVSGRFGLQLLDNGQAAESTDGGWSWRTFDLPDLGGAVGAESTWGCGPVGCALGRWLRVGWGETRVAGDLAAPPKPAAPKVKERARTSAHLGFDCELSGVVELHPNAPERGAPSSPPGWYAMAGAPPPKLQPGGAAFTGGVQTAPASRIYAWRSAEGWPSGGRLQGRFEDPFDPSATARLSDGAAPPWPTDSAAEGVIHGYTTWRSLLDPGGQAAILQGCRGGGCLLFGVVNNEPITAFRTANTNNPFVSPPLAESVVRGAGGRWYYLEVDPQSRRSPSQGFSLVRVSAEGEIETVRALSLPTSRQPARVRLIRRAASQALGVLLVAPADVLSGEEWLVVPIDADTGALGEAQRLGANDLAGPDPLSGCAPGDDGWLFDTDLGAPSVFDMAVERQPVMQSVRYRVHLDRGRRCVEAISATVVAEGTAMRPRRVAVAGDAIPLIARSSDGERVSTYACTSKHRRRE